MIKLGFCNKIVTVHKLIASSGKPFTDGEFVKKCMNAVAEEVCPERKDVLNAVSLSASTITRCIEELGGNVHAQLQQKTKEFDFFSLALDESTDVQDTAQLLIFIRGVSANFEMYEELAALKSLKGTTTGEDIFCQVCQTMEDLDLDWSKLASITTDGALSMVGVSRGLIGRMNREMEERGLTAPLQVHCLIHQQELCCKVLTWDSVMKVVVSCINFIRAKGLKSGQFQEFLSELGSAHGDVLYHTEVRWLSWGRVLRRFYELLPEINAFLHSKDKTVPELIDPAWKWHLAFLTDVTEMLNSFNLQLQGQGKLICDMYSHIKAFEVKQALLLEQVKKHNFIHLPATQNLSAENPAVPFPAEKCVEALEMLKAEFGVRFRELHVNAKEIRLFQNPFVADIDEAQPSYQFELAELQNCDVLKDAFKPNSLIDFYAALPNDTENVQDIERLRRAVKQEAKELEMHLNELGHYYDHSLKMSEPATICEEDGVPMADLPILVFSSECQLSVTVVGCEHKSH
ncbi:general transcription factor II-I repeat domain-containing protein 2-like [Seriola lalandi dorsalis]|uniref:general transcription factor II-I repeat domain-containing protein 2-like n=1 Tax=Seriola lalandi dorsalis TaxID=1841481 RepID=UPI000C6FBBA9|nr:general transcription factor II-I repeat domain-containing protein 2-like [Seriola lalandi dorsalis]